MFLCLDISRALALSAMKFSLHYHFSCSFESNDGNLASADLQLVFYLRDTSFELSFLGIRELDINLPTSFDGTINHKTNFQTQSESSFKGNSYLASKDPNAYVNLSIF